MVECICGPNIGIITICVDLWWGQTQNGLSFDFEIEFDLEVHGQPPPPKKKKKKNNRNISTKIFIPLVQIWWSWFTSVIELPHRLNCWRTHGLMDTQTDDAGNNNTRKPKLTSSKNESIGHFFLLLYRQNIYAWTDMRTDAGDDKTPATELSTFGWSISVYTHIYLYLLIHSFV